MWVETSQLQSLQTVEEEEEHNGDTGTDQGEGRIGEGVLGEEHSFHMGPYMAGTVAVDTVAVDTVAVDMVAVDMVAVDTVAVDTVAVDTVAVDTVVAVADVDFEFVVVGLAVKFVVERMETETLNHKSEHLWVWLELRMLLTPMKVVWKSLCQ